MSHSPKILVYGYGNPGRQDDGLGLVVTEQAGRWIEAQGMKYVETEINYQLNIEDAETVHDKDLVIFIDASKENIGQFLFTECRPDSKVEFTMHSVSPSFVLYLCNRIYGNIPRSFLMHIKGYEWEFREGLSDQALVNSGKALEFLKGFITDYINNTIQHTD